MNSYPFINVNYENTKESPEEKEGLDLELTLKYDRLFQKSNAAMPSICIRIGLSRLYYVFDFEKLFAAMDDGHDLRFGQNFIYNSAYYYFSPEDMEIINLIRELYEIDGIFMNQRRGSSAYLPDGIIEEKWIFLPDAYLERLYKILRHKIFKLEISSPTMKDTLVVDTIYGDPSDYQFHLAITDSGYRLTYNFTILKLSHSFHYCLLNGYVVELKRKTIQGLIPLFEGLLTGEEIPITPDKQEHFIAQVVPYIKQFASLTLDPELEASIVEAPLRAEVYLDKKGPHIFAKPMFYYDQYEINPFHYESNQGLPIIFRDQDREEQVLSCFSDFVIKADGLYLYDENRSFDFLTDSLPTLFELGEVFYSDAFKSIKINTSPTIRSRVSYANEDNLLDFSFEVDSVDKEELRQLFKAIKLKKKYYRLNNGSYVGLVNNGLEDFANLIDRLQLNYSDLTKERVRLPAFRGLMIDEFSKGTKKFQLKRKSSFKQLVSSLQSPDEDSIPCPQELEDILRDYQITGYTWLKTLAKYGFGGILADDMGLGKSLQTIAFIISEYEVSKLPTLIIAPTSLVFNWNEEIHKFLPDLEILIVDGPPDTRAQLIRESHRYPIVVTSYPLIRRDILHYDKIHFNYCIIDEAQHIKNPKSQNAMSVKQIHANAYFALTGTPIENHLTELWSIFDFVMPKLLFNHNKFVEMFETPISRDHDDRALQRLKSIINPFIMRRLKTEVLKELPEKIETKVVSIMTEEQNKLYLAHLEEARRTVQEELNQNTYSHNQIKILSLITRLRQICCHPSMFIEGYNGGSGKMDLLMELIEESIESGHKILLFSQYTSMLKLIREKLLEANIDLAYLDGQIPSHKRKDIIHRFNHGHIPIFLISLKAGGTGLNLTAADVVIHFDPWWNPAVEDQATDRAYRIGQEKNVQVFKLIAKGTIEEKIYHIQRRKKELADSVITSDTSGLEGLNADHIKEILDIL